MLHVFGSFFIKCKRFVHAAPSFFVFSIIPDAKENRKPFDSFVRFCYDGKNDTIAKGNRDDIPENVTAGKVSNARFNVYNSAWGKTISIYSYLSASDRYNNYEMYVYDLSGTKIDTIILGDCRFNSYSKVVKYTIPQNVAYIINNNYNMSSCGIWEISISN